MKNAISLLLILCGTAISQVSDSSFVKTQQRPVILEIGYDFFSEYDIYTLNNEKDKTPSEVEFSQRTQVKLNFPLYFSDKFLIAGGLRHYAQKFTLDFKEPSTSDLTISRKLDDPLQRFGVRGYLIYKWKKNRTIYANLGFDVNTAKPLEKDFSRNHLKSSFNVLVSHPRDRFSELAYGLGFGYEWGQPLVLPLVKYNRQLNNTWDIEVLVPKNIELRYAWSKKLFFRSELQISGASYSLVEQSIAGYDRLEIRQSEVSLALHADREIYDWAWINLRGGILRSLKMNIVDPGLLGDKDILTTKDFTNWFFGLNLFFVPPQALYEKYIK